MARELIVYCDESVLKGRYFSNFYGGLLVRSGDYDTVVDKMRTLKSEMGLRAEMKWNAITPSIDERYCCMMSALFKELEADTVKIRIMFTQNRDIPDLTPLQQSTSYHRLYYQFIKHAFGLEYAGVPDHTTRVRLLLDRMPTTDEQTAQFKSFVAALSHQPSFRKAGIFIPYQAIGQIDSHQHILSQCLDVVLGAMAFRLNDRHKDKPQGSYRRGRRTKAKERVYKHINSCIQKLYPRFNIGVSTACPHGPSDRWEHPYRHWLLVPHRSRRDNSRTKKRKAP